MDETESTAIPLLTPADGVPSIVSTDEELRSISLAIHKGTGPIALDAERASSYRYSARAYLIQLRRNNAGTFLIDPIKIQDFSNLASVLEDTEWILHAATQDLPCLAELGLKPKSLFDTEHAAKLLGRNRVGLQGLLETELNLSLAKEHSAADWSTRPLPEPWLIYAALDVEKLIELREILLQELIDSQRLEWATQDFAYLSTWLPGPQKDEPWRKTSGIHKVREPKQLAIIRELWFARDAIGKEIDKAVGKVLPDAAIIDLAKNDLKSARDVFMLDSIRNRSQKALADHWWQIRKMALALPENELPKANNGKSTIPPTKAWEEKNPIAFKKFSLVRPKVVALAESLNLAPEVLISPEIIRQLCWQGYQEIESSQDLNAWMQNQTARVWQADLVEKAIFPLIHAL